MLESQLVRVDTLFRRHPANPILTAEQWPYPVNSVFNPGAVLLPDGTTLLLCRVEDFRGHSHLSIARSKNGVDGWQIDSEPALSPAPEQFPDEIWGIEDPRITFLPEIQAYGIVYTSYSANGPGVSLATTTDFRTYERHGSILAPEDKDAALFPQRFGNDWLLIHRPVRTSGIRTRADIWLSRSSDLRHWRDSKMILEARRGAWWDAIKIGLSPPPIRTERGWLLIYHGVRTTASGAIYRLGLALFDLDDPSKGLLRGDSWVFGPKEPYERQGDVDDVVFPCGYTVAADGDTLRIYYGAADSCIGLATASIRTLLVWLDQNGSASAFRTSDAEKIADSV